MQTEVVSKSDSLVSIYDIQKELELNKTEQKVKQFEEKETNRIKKRNELKKLLIKILYISFLFVVCCFGIFLYITDKKIIGSFIGLIVSYSNSMVD